MTWVENNPWKMGLVASLIIISFGAISELVHDTLSKGYLLWSPLIFAACFSVSAFSYFTERGFKR